MEKKDLIYNAFISYRHAELDSFVAESLHKLMENFKVPKLAGKEIKDKGKQRITRLFRDKDELPISCDLNDPIITALKASEFLIVICSPRTKESIWVEREIETFIEFHGHDHILAVLIEGEPGDSFPEALCTRKKEIHKEDGTIEVVKQKVEPLAADVRGLNKKLVYKQLKSEIIRLMAPILGCGYDDLKQRHKEQKLKKVIMASIACSAIFLVVGSLSTVQALRIQKQSLEISEKSKQIEAENNKNLKLLSKSMSSESLGLLEQGDRMRAILLALEALPKDLDNMERPLVADGQYALTEALQVYTNQSKFLPDCIFEHNTFVRFAKLSPQGNTVASVDELGYLYIWNMDTKEMSAKSKEPYAVESDETFCYLDEERLLIGGKDGIVCINIESLEVKWSLTDSYVGNMKCSEDLTLAALGNAEEVTILDTATGKIIYEKKDLNGSFGGVYSFSSNNNLFAYPSTNISSKGKGEIVVVNLGTKKNVMKVQTQYSWTRSLLLSDDGSLNVTCSSSEVTSKLGMYGNGKIYLFNEEGEEEWCTESTLALSDSLCFFDGDEDVFLFSALDRICLVSKKTGVIIRQIAYESSISNFYNIEGSNMLVISLKNGSVFVTTIIDTEDYSQSYLETSGKQVKNIYQYRNKMVLIPNKSNGIYIYTNALAKKAETVVDLETKCSEILFNSEESLFAATSSAGDICLVFDVKKNMQIGMISLTELGDVLETCFVNNEDHLLIIGTENIVIYDCKDLQEIARVSVDYASSYAINDRGDKLYLSTYNKIQAYNLKTLALEKEFDTNISFGQLLLINNGATLIEYNEQGEGIVLQIKEGKVVECPWKASIVVGVNGYIVADSNTQEIKYFSDSNETPDRTLEVPVNLIQYMGMNTQGDKFFITYMDQVTKIYNVKDFSVVATLSGQEGYISQWSQAGEYEIFTDENISADGNSYLFNKKFGRISRIPNMLYLTKNGDITYIGSYSEILKVPIYDLSMLMDEAKGQLKGRELTQDEKELYFVN